MAMDESVRVKKALHFNEIDQAVKFDIPVSPNHEFFTNFADVRGEFQEDLVYSALNVSQDPKSGVYTYNETNPFNKSLIFLAGHRGSGKTSEIKKWVQNLDNPECFLCIICDIDKGLDRNDVEYMDILIFQLELLFERLEKENVSLQDDILQEMQQWYSETAKEVNSKLSSQLSIESGIEGKASIPYIFSLFSKLKANIAGSTERATVIRTTLKNNFSIFAAKFNQFINIANQVVRGMEIQLSLP